MKLIVSLTSTSRRIDGVHRVLSSLREQTLMPDEVYLFLSHEAYIFDGGIAKAPKALRELAKVRFVPNTGPYRKLLPILQEKWGQEVLIVTVDDDTDYPEYFLRRLVREYDHCGCVVSIRGRKIVPGKHYWEWPNIEKAREPRMSSFPVGQSGILYHPKFFTERVFDGEALKLCPFADEPWIHCNTRLTETPARILGGRFSLIHEYDRRLYSINQTENDVQLMAAAKYLGLDDFAANLVV
jgi:hypothetical protein